MSLSFRDTLGCPQERTCGDPDSGLDEQDLPVRQEHEGTELLKDVSVADHERHQKIVFAVG